MERMHGRTGMGFDAVDTAFTERVRIKQRKLAAELKSHYDFIVCGSGKRDWGFKDHPNPHLNGRSIPPSIGLSGWDRLDAKPGPIQYVTGDISPACVPKRNVSN
jgi:hypothetical protein